MKEAYLYKKLSGKKVQCRNCAHYCLILPGQRGKCGVRKNIDGKLYSLVYGKVVAAHIDPIEKKPLFHFLPGSQSLSIATVGCQFSCKWCFLPETYLVCQNDLFTLEEIFNSGKEFKLRTRDGVIKKINPYQTIDHTGKLQKILHAFKHFYDGEILKIKPYYTPEILCTPYHQVFATNDFLKEPQKIKAQELTQNYYLAIPKNFSFPKKEVVLDLKEILSSKLGKKYIKKLKLTEKEGQIKFSNEKGYIPRFIKLDKNLAKLFGYYCGEGYVCQSKNRFNSYTLVFSFGPNEKMKAEEVKNLLKKIFDIKSQIRKKGDSLDIETSKTSISLFFKILCGQKAENKKIPHFLNQSPKEVVHSFLRAYVERDGCYLKSNIPINTTSKKLALGIYWLWLKMGFLPSFYQWIPSPQKRIENRLVNQKPLYYVKLGPKKFREKFLSSRKKMKIDPRNEKNVKFFENDKYWLVPILRISKQKYSGWVYNVEVEKNRSFLANFISVGNCQNWEISQGPKLTGKIEGENLWPEEIVKMAKKYKVPSISYTYTDPVIFSEYALDTMKLAKKEGLKNNWVTGGFFSKELLEMVSPYLDAANVDLKGFSEEFYRQYCGGRLKPVLDTLIGLKEKGVWLEITTLIIPTLNDDEKNFQGIAKWIYENLGPETPWHVTQFSGVLSWQMQHLPDTQIETLEKAWEIGKKIGLKYVYTGNVPGLPSEDTLCPKCGTLCIERTNYLIHRHDKSGKCPKCGQDLNLILK